MKLFTYKHGNSVFHNLDTRYKLVMMSLVSIAVLKALFPALAVLFIILVSIMLNIGIKPIQGLHHIKYFFVFLIFIFISRILTTPGDTIFSLSGITISIEGIKTGAQITMRYLIIILLSIIFSNTTKPSSIKGAVQWFLKPLPFIPEKKAGLMVGLSIRFLPLIIEQVQQIAYAQKARCSDNQKNPVKKIIKLVPAVLRKTFQTADSLALAMESRGFSEERTEPEFNKSGREIISLSLTLIIATILVLY